MKKSKLFTAVVCCILLCALSSSAQEKGYWRAESTTARSITGDIAFSDTKLSINFSNFTIAPIRNLTPAETSAVFSAAGPNQTANLYSLVVPASKQFLHHNTLCGSDETQYAVVYVIGRNLQLAFFSGASIPVFTPEALAGATTLCGTYTYVR